ncbi:MFS transporter [Microbacterium rhizophilus]|uniref:MFS transporter n=1 Tax=Microbacterium rhizophilus TaxID=3138934 RepID=UPI0031EC7879
MSGEPQSGPRAALRVPAYRRWFAAQIFSASGSATQLVGMTWLIASATDSGVALGALTFAIFIPVLVFGPWAGRVIDHVDRRVLLLWTQLAFLAIAVALIVMAILGSVVAPVLYGLALATGLVNALDAPARQVYVMDVLPRRMLPSAIGLYEVMMNSARVLGPGIAGLLLLSGDTVLCFVFNALGLLPAIVALLRNRGQSSHAPDRAPAGDPPSMWAGLRWSFAHPRVLIVLVLAATGGMLFNLAPTVPLMATRSFALGGDGYGLLSAVFGAGALLGALWAASRHRPPTGRSVVRLAWGTGAAVVLAAAAPAWGRFALGLAVAGALGIWFISRANAYVQLAAPTGLRGQVMSVWNMAIPGMNPFTGLLAGFVADAVSARVGFGLSGALFLVFGTVALVVSARAARRS